MAEQKFAASAIIFNEGDAAQYAYIIIDGKVEIFTHRDGKDIKTGEYGPGELIGDTGIFDAGAPHVNGARAKTDTTVDAISFDELTEMVQKSPPRLVPIISSVFERLYNATQRVQQKETISAVQDVDAEKITVSGGNDETQIQPKSMPISHLPMRIGGYQRDSEPDRNHGNHVLIATEGPPLIVSSHHCEIITEDGGLYLRDQGSRFGTTVNGMVIGRGKGVYKAPLQKGDNEVILGEHKTSPYRITVHVA